MLISAFASWRRPALIVSGTSPEEAGPKKAEPAPTSADVTASCHVSAEPPMSRIAAVACAIARTISAPIITSRRGSRSAHTPPASVSSARGSM
jgi:hypothetical protein